VLLSASWQHYFLWIIVMFGVVWAFYHFGYWWVSALLTAAYLPSFFDKVFGILDGVVSGLIGGWCASVRQAHLKNGRVWHGYRKHWCVFSRLLRLTAGSCLLQAVAPVATVHEYGTAA
jgi:hypothetical protein